ncbi:MAG TPA: SMP-30/gluconolactonase/LRE family protein [archaeon]|nr:SMP-30/gluconolactonase/LRE family protein [archaeon]
MKARVLLSSIFLSISALVLLSALQNGLGAAQPCDSLPFEIVAEGFKFPEGPTFDSAGNLYVVAYRKSGDIGVIRPNGKVEVFLDLEAMGEGAANGMAYSPDGRIFACEYEGRRIISIDLATRKVSTVVDNYKGQPLNRPNDIFLCDNGDIYFTDPNRVDETRGGRVFVYSQDEKKLYLLLDGLAFPNGLAVSADRRTLYVAQTVRRNVTAYPLYENGHAAGEGWEVFLMSGGEGPDGIELDEAGNLYIAHYGSGKVYLVEPEGTLLCCVTGFGRDTANLQIHGEWLYITDAKDGRVVRIKRMYFTAP